MSKKSRNQSNRKAGFAYYVREGLTSVFVHGFTSLAAMLVIAACLMITGIFSLVAYNIDLQIRELEGKSEIVIYIDERVSRADAQALGARIICAWAEASATQFAQHPLLKTASLPQILLRSLAEHQESMIIDGVDDTQLSYGKLLLLALIFCRRIRKLTEVFSMYRIDHVLGFYRIYAFPWMPDRNPEFLPLSEDEAAARCGGRRPGFRPHGDWTEDERRDNLSRGDYLLRQLLKAAPGVRVVGEDLGCVPDYVRPD